jgi:hypothetical protein
MESPELRDISDSVGGVSSVVYRMVAPEVAQVKVTYILPGYDPPGGSRTTSSGWATPTPINKSMVAAKIFPLFPSEPHLLTMPSCRDLVRLQSGIIVLIIGTS